MLGGGGGGAGVRRKTNLKKEEGESAQMADGIRQENRCEICVCRTSSF